MDIAQVLPATAAVLEDGIHRGHHFGGQVAICQGGELTIDAAFGQLHPESDAPVRTDHIYCWRSAGKPWTAVSILRRIAEGQASLDQKLDLWLPPETRHLTHDDSPTALNIAAPTIAQVLTHTTSWQPLDAGWPGLTWEESVKRVYDVVLRESRMPGDVAAYDPQAGWFALAALLLTWEMLPFKGTSFALLADREVFQPANVEAFFALQGVIERDIQERLAPQFNTLRGARHELALTSDDALRRPSPGSSCRGPISSLAKLYATLLKDRTAQDDNTTLLPADIVQQMTARHREDMLDETFQHKLDFGLGVIVNSNRYGAETVPYGFGRYAGESAFGHGGAQCAMGFADPDHDLSVAWVLNGLPGEPRHNKRNREINSALYKDLGLAS